MDKKTLIKKDHQISDDVIMSETNNKSVNENLKCEWNIRYFNKLPLVIMKKTYSHRYYFKFDKLLNVRIYLLLNPYHRITGGLEFTSQSNTGARSPPTNHKYIYSGSVYITSEQLSASSSSTSSRESNGTILYRLNNSNVQNYYESYDDIKKLSMNSNENTLIVHCNLTRMTIKLNSDSTELPRLLENYDNDGTTENYIETLLQNIFHNKNHDVNLIGMDGRKTPAHKFILLASNRNTFRGLISNINTIKINGNNNRCNIYRMHSKPKFIVKKLKSTIEEQEEEKKLEEAEKQRTSSGDNDETSLYRIQINKNDKMEMVINDFNSDTIREMIAFIYGGDGEMMKRYSVDGRDDIASHSNNPIELYNIAFQFQLDPLRRLCKHILIDSMNASNVTEIYQLADHYNDERLKSIAAKYICKHSKVVCVSNEWTIMRLYAPTLIAELWNYQN